MQVLRHKVINYHLMLLIDFFNELIYGIYYIFCITIRCIAEIECVLLYEVTRLWNHPHAVHQGNWLDHELPTNCQAFRFRKNWKKTFNYKSVHQPQKEGYVLFNPECLITSSFCCRKILLISNQNLRYQRYQSNLTWTLRNMDSTL